MARPLVALLAAAALSVPLPALADRIEVSADGLVRATLEAPGREAPALAT